MKHIKIYENFENNSGDFYSKFWINGLTEAFSQTEVDKFNSIKPLYGGGTISQIGYKVNIESDDINYFILEGITNNGIFIKSSIIIFDKDNQGIYHGSLKTVIDNNDTHEDNITKVISEITSKLNEFLNS